MNSAIIICTRPESKRLPRKVFKVINGLPAIEHLLNRLVVKSIPIILAVPDKCDEYNYLKKKYPHILIMHGDPDSPLHRMAKIVEDDKSIEWIVRITHDDILIDVDTMILLLEECQKQKAGYGCTPTIVEGAGVEVIHRANLLHAAKTRIAPTEYISYFVKDFPRSRIVRMKPDADVQRNYRLTLDYPEDAIVLETILRDVGNNASLDRIVEYIDKNKYLLNYNKQPELTIYTCAYNAESTIHETMSSVFDNNMQGLDYEYIFIDDGSTDRTLSEAMRFNNEKRIRYIINESNMGLATSSNIALSHARGDYVMRLDADDIIMAGRLNPMINYARNNHLVFIYSAYYEINEQSVLLSTMKKDPWIHHHAGCALMSRRAINEIRFRDGLRHWDSKELYERIANKKDIGYITEPLWEYRIRENSLSHKMTDERIEALGKLNA